MKKRGLFWFPVLVQGEELHLVMASLLEESPGSAGYHRARDWVCVCACKQAHTSLSHPPPASSLAVSSSGILGITAPWSDTEDGAECQKGRESRNLEVWVSDDTFEPNWPS